MTADINKYPKLKEVANDLGINPFWLWLTIQHESSWKPNALNFQSGAAGLIQFMPNTASALGTSTASILKSNVDQQLDLVYKYLLPYRGKMKDIDDVYFAVFYPYAIGKSSNYILGSEKGMARAKLIAQQNPANNPDKNDTITVREVKKVIREKAKTYGYSPIQDAIYKLTHLF